VTLASSLDPDLMDHRRSRRRGPVLLLDEADEALDELPIEGTQLGRGKTVVLCGIGPSGRGCICFSLGNRNR
jgi:hypothetical protein